MSCPLLDLLDILAVRIESSAPTSHHAREPSRRGLVLATRFVVALFARATAATLAAQAPSPSAGQRYNLLLTQYAMRIVLTGNPPRGPIDMLIEGSTIAPVAPSTPPYEICSRQRD